MSYFNYEWYFANQLTCPETEVVLSRNCKEGRFLVRDSCTYNHYTLHFVYKMGGKFNISQRYILTDAQGRFHLSGDTETHTTLDALIDHLKVCEQHGIPTLLTDPPEILLGKNARTFSIPPSLKPRNVMQAAPKIPKKSQHSWEIELTELEIFEKVGAGSFGKVYRGKLRGTADVAIKMLYNDYMTEEAFLKEAQVMTELQHPNVVRLCGICTTRRPYFIVTEYMDHGALIFYILKHKKVLLRDHVKLQRICAQVCFGMAYLEEQKFIHRDLASRNCLVSGGLCNGVVKVSDFGMSKFMQGDEYHGSTQSVIPIYSVPPEVLKYRRFSSKSDVWAFGLLMYEVYSGGKAPYDQLSQKEVKFFVEEGYTMQKPEAASEHDYSIMQRCWSFHPDDRPSFAQLSRYYKQVV